MPVSKRKPSRAAKSLKKSIQSVRRTVKKVLRRAFSKSSAKSKLKNVKSGLKAVKSSKSASPRKAAEVRRPARRAQRRITVKPRVQVVARQEEVAAPEPVYTPSSAPWDIPLPQAYHEDKLVLMVRDPWWLYAYWELTPGNRQGVEERLRREGAAVDRLVLRVYDVTDCELPSYQSYFDLCVDFASNWYVDVGRPDRDWVAELGWRTADGRFVALVRSNSVRTPRFGISDVLDEEWLLPEELMRKLYGMSTGLPAGASSLAVREHWEKYLRGLVSSDTARRDTAAVRRTPHLEPAEPRAAQP